MKNHIINSGIEFINSNALGKPIILHTDIGNISKLLQSNGKTKIEIFSELHDLLKEDCGSSSIFIPTFDYEYCSSKYYNPATSNSQLGAFSRYCFNTLNAYRTLVPVFNHVDIKGAHKPINELYRLDRAFGKDSFYDWFTNQGGYIFFWGCNLKDSNTYVHHAETIAQITYRFRKVFQGCVQTEHSLTELDYEFNVRPSKLDISYIDQGKGILATEGSLLCQEESMIEGFSAQEYLSIISKSLIHDEFALLTSKSRMEISKYLANQSTLREITEDKKSIRLLSDSTLDFITRGWNSSAYIIKSVYTESLILELERLAQVKSLECSALLIMPSLDSFSIGTLDAYSSVPIEINDVVEGVLTEFIVRIKELRHRHPSAKIVFVSPFRSSIASQLADSQNSEFAIAEIFARLEKIVFGELDAINVSFEKAIESSSLTRNILYSTINYLRYRYPFDISCTSMIREIIEGIINKQFLSTKEIKAISVDLDNTLWRGIAGDDSAEISKDFPSNSNLALQKVLMQLRKRGVFLTITSKNDMSTVKDTFQKFRSKMILSISDFSCIEANWQKKSSSLLKQASELNISIDSFLHIDDSDLELSEIMSSLPKVETLKFVPEEIEYILNFLLMHPRLRKASLTKSDKARIQNSRSQASISSSSYKLSTGDYSYLESLEIHLNVIHEDDKLFDFKRSCQLLSKTNQFNTSQKTYELLASEVNLHFKTFNLVYFDKNKIQECCSVICAQHEAAHDELVIASFVLSCRFFARGLEYFFLEKVWKNYQAKKLSILFRMSRKNTPAFEYINTITNDAEVTLQIKKEANDLMKISINIEKLREQSAKFRMHYAQC